MVRTAVVLFSVLLAAACGSSIDQKGGKSGKIGPDPENNGASNNGTSNSGEMNCGDGILDPGELCDPGIAEGTGACPTSCQAPSCSTAMLAGSAESCTAQCITEPVACASGDGCCPSGCDAASDAECTNTCGDGVVDGPESCDGDCPQSCSDGDACTSDTLVGAADACSAQCRFDVVTTCIGGDGCCPAGCSNANDSDCEPPAATCGNDIVDDGERCDGNCPTSCNDGNACTTDALVGAASSCTAHCSYQQKTTCQSNDGCCPSGCTSQNDNDCACVPRTCAQAGAECGSISDGCGSTIQCSNTCSSAETCNSNRCATADSYIGEPCTEYLQCGSAQEATCILPPWWPDGYCSLTCNTTSCPSGSHCAQFDSQDKLCMLDCASNADCRNGYECRNFDGSGAKECAPPPRETSGVGGACTDDADCDAGYVCQQSWADSNGNTVATFPGGACTLPCISLFASCPGADGVCTDDQYCAKECVSNADCRTGYSCQYNTFAQKDSCNPI